MVPLLGVLAYLVAQAAGSLPMKIPDGQGPAAELTGDGPCPGAALPGLLRALGQAAQLDELQAEQRDAVKHAVQVGFVEIAAENPLAMAEATWTARLPASAVLYGPKPPRTGKRGRPRVKGDRLGTCAQIAQAADWEQAVINVYGQDAAVQITAAEALWHGSFKTAPGRVVLLRDPGSPQAYDLGLVTLDASADPAAIAERYSWRWPIEPSNATGKQVAGVGDACNRTRKAVKRTVPFGFLIQSLLIVWYPVAADRVVSGLCLRPPSGHLHF